MSETDDLDSLLRAVASAPPVRPPPRVGERLGGRYLVEAFLGEGGMGAVYRALDTKLGEAVALKVVRGAFEHALHDEVRLAQKVTHPNVCRTFGLEELDGHQLITMELVAGETLAARLRREPRLPVSEVLRIARAIGEGLAAAHAKQIVHGDLKPANVMLDGQRVVLMDFGVARLAAAPVDGLRGTVGYLAPEQLTRAAVDQRADLYALGCVVYEMLAGRPAINPVTPATPAGQVAGPVPALRAARPDAPRWLCRAVERLLSANPADRPAGVTQLFAGPRARGPVVAALVLVATAVVGAAAWQAARPRVWVPHVQRLPVYDENGDGVSLSKNGAWLAFASDRRDHHRWRPYLMSTTTGEAAVLSSPEEPDLSDVTGVRWSRDDTAVLYSRFLRQDEPPHLFRQAVEGTPPHAVGPPTDLGPGSAPEACGIDLVFVEAAFPSFRVLAQDPRGQRRRLFTPDAREIVNVPRCDPKGTRVVVVAGEAYASAGNDVYLVDLSGRAQRLTYDHRSMDATFNAAGDALVVSQNVEGRLQLVELPLDGGAARRLLTDEGPDTVADVSRDGRLLAVMRDETSFFPAISSPAGPQTLTRERGVFWWPLQVTEKLVVAQREVGGTLDVTTIGLDDGAITVLARGSAPFPSLDRQSIFFAGAQPEQLLSVQLDGGTPRLVARLPGKISFGSAGVDGLHLATLQDGGEYEGFRVTPEGVVEPEVSHGLVTVAPSGGWRAVTRLARDHFAEATDLLLVPPGAALDQPERTLRAVTLHNLWFDAHRIGYCTQTQCELLDVTTGTTVPIASPGMHDGMSTIMLDGTHLLGETMVARVSRFLVTNFDER